MLTGQALAGVLDDGADDVRVQELEQRLLAREAGVEAPDADAGATGDLGDRQTLVAALREQLDRGRDDALLGPAAASLLGGRVREISQLGLRSLLIRMRIVFASWRSFGHRQSISARTRDVVPTDTWPDRALSVRKERGVARAVGPGPQEGEAMMNAIRLVGVLAVFFVASSWSSGQGDGGVVVGPVDLDAVALQDAEREAAGLPPRFAIPFRMNVDPDQRGEWETLRDGNSVWRLRVEAPGARSINLGFSSFELPRGAQLLLYSEDGRHVVRPFTAADNDAHGELWTPIVPTESLIVQLTVPTTLMDRVQLQLGQVGYGYRGFAGAFNAGGVGGVGPASGPCNIDVVCPEGDGWRAEIPSVAVYSLGGSTFCTGFMINNTSNDFRPFFMTAKHCGITNGNASSLVVYWNYETTVCDGTPDGNFNDFQTGSTWRAAYSASDFTLVELDDDPDSGWELSWAGWDASGADASSAVAIHHPNTDEKRISFEFEPTRTTSYLGNSSPGDGTHVKVLDWDLGTTEPGSSGSPLFDQDHRVIGQLHGGYAACGNDSADWYGKFSRSYAGNGGGSNSLSPWLDAAGTGLMTTDTIRAALLVSPSGTIVHEGPPGGPFSNPQVVYTLTNHSSISIDYDVTLTQFIGLLLDGGTTPVSGSLIPGASDQVTVSVGPDLDLLPPGVTTETVRFEDLTNGQVQNRTHEVEVGRTLFYSFDLDTNPGWAADGKWKWGPPTGQGGGEAGNPDPGSGDTGSNVYGFNLSGDYRNNLGEKHLTTDAIDCTGLSGVEVLFSRWLNVETSSYDHARFRVSKNGSSWTTVWENSGEITDSSWTQRSYDISVLADGQPTVYLRWTMGTTDDSVVYSGWNIDDIEIRAFGAGSISQYGSGCPGTGGLVPQLTGSGEPTPNGHIDLTISDGLPGGFGLLFLGLSQDLSGSTCFVVAPPFLLRFPRFLNGSGSSSIGGDIPGGSPTDFHLYLQFFGADPGAAGSLSASNGLDVYLR